MRKFSVYFLLLLLVFTPVILSCDDDDDYVYYPPRIATVQRLSEEAAPYFVLDNGKSLWVSASSVPFKNLPTGQRVLGYFEKLADREDQFDYDVHLFDYRKVLTKGIIELTEANEDSIGNSKAYITNAWLASDYLNIEFWIVTPSKEPHRVNLVKNADEELVVDSEGYINLEFRYNDMGDTYGHLWPSLVSYKLNLFDVPPTERPNGIKLKINSIRTGENIIKLDYPIEAEEKTNLLQNVNSEKID